MKTGFPTWLNNYISKLRLLISPGSFKAHVATMMTGTVIAQVITVVAAPILTRWYTAENFGSFLLYVSFTIILSTLVTGRYEQSIVVQKEDSDALRLLTFTLILVCFCSLTILFFLLIFAPSVARLTRDSHIQFWLYFVPLSVVCTAASDICTCWFIRKKLFSIVAKRRVVQAVIMIMVQLILGAVSIPFGLIVGWIAGDILVATFFIFTLFSMETGRLRDSWQGLSFKNVAVQHRQFPLYDAPAILIHTLTNQLPVILCSSFFGPAIAGFYGFTQRILNIPITFVAQSISDVFKQRISAEYARVGTIWTLYLKTIKSLHFVVVPFLAVLLLFAPQLFVFIFGKEWVIAGRFAQYLSVYYSLRFYSSATSFVFILQKKQVYNLCIQISMLIAVMISLYIGYFYQKNALLAIFILGFLGSVVYLVSWRLINVLAEKHA
ncbi:MAG: oligosaccharide flippase family protein [Candidatus Omnitrophota bacterium]|jgi:O-antigen/teichoic acid export membrane protein